MSPTRLWAICWIRRVVYVSGSLIVVLIACAGFFRVHSLRDLMAYVGMADECHPVWRAFAFREFAAGDSSTALFAKYSPTRKEEFGQYGIYQFIKGGTTDGIAFTGFSVITKDTRLIAAGAGSCTWSFTFFEDIEPDLDRAYKAYLQERLAQRRQARENQRGR